MPGRRLPWIIGLVAFLAALPAAGGEGPSRAEARLEAAAQEFAAARFGVELRTDPALRAVAREHALLAASGVVVDTQEFLRQAESAHGILDPYPYVFYGSAAASDVAEIERRLLRACADFAPSERRLYTHVAVGVVERRRGWLRHEGQDYVTVLLTQRAVSFAPLPAESRPGDRVLFEGEVHAPFRDPEILLTRPDGNTEVLDNLALEPRHFRCYLRFDRGAGEYQLEVMGRYDLGPRVLGLGSLYPRPAGELSAHERLLAAAQNGTLEAVRAAAAPAQEPRTEAEAEARLVLLVNRDRRRSGLPELEPDTELAALARAHSRDMRDHAFFAHVSPQSGRLADRAERGGVRYRRLAENIAVDSDVDAAEAALLRSPGHRLNLLSPQFTRLGVGVAFDADAQGNRRAHVTQVFLLPAP